MRAFAFHSHPFVAHFYSWEAKTKAEKKQRRHRNPSLNRNPAASAKGSSQPRRRSRAPINAHSRRATRCGKALPPGRAFFALASTKSASRIAEFNPPPLEYPRSSQRLRRERFSLKMRVHPGGTAMPSKCAATLLTIAVFATTAWSQQPTLPAPRRCLPLSHPTVPSLAWLSKAAEPSAWPTSASSNGLRSTTSPLTAWPEPAWAPWSARSMPADTPAEMSALAESDAFNNVFTLQTPYVDSSFRRRQDRRQVPAAATTRPQARSRPAQRAAFQRPRRR
jgi:hypothetical protein